MAVIGGEKVLWFWNELLAERDRKASRRAADGIHGSDDYRHELKAEIRTLEDILYPLKRILLDGRDPIPDRDVDLLAAKGLSDEQFARFQGVIQYEIETRRSALARENLNSQSLRRHQFYIDLENELSILDQVVQKFQSIVIGEGEEKTAVAISLK